MRRSRNTMDHKLWKHLSVSLAGTTGSDDAYLCVRMKNEAIVNEKVQTVFGGNEK